MKDRPVKLFEVDSEVTVVTGNCGKLFLLLSVGTGFHSVALRFRLA